jgi:hypothetical protein
MNELLLCVPSLIFAGETIPATNIGGVLQTQLIPICIQPIYLLQGKLLLLAFTRNETVLAASIE